MEEAVWKMTGLPADRLRLTQRGLIRTGYWADIAIWNPETIADTAIRIRGEAEKIGRALRDWELLPVATERRPAARRTVAG